MTPSQSAALERLRAQAESPACKQYGTARFSFKDILALYELIKELLPYAEP